MATFAERLKELRLSSDLLQKELSEKLNLNRSTLGSWESGNRVPELGTVQKLADFFGVSIDYLLGREEITKLKKDPIQGIKIPVLGHVVAGVPVEAITDILDYEEIHPDIVQTGQFFALKIKGKSMEPLFIEGDTVIVRSQPTVESGEIAIVLVNGNEATTKKVKITENGIMLIGSNTAVYEPHFYSNEEIEKLPIDIIGKVIELRRTI